MVERKFSWIGNHYRLLVRHEKLISVDMAFLHISVF